MFHIKNSSFQTRQDGKMKCFLLCPIMENQTVTLEGIKVVTVGVGEPKGAKIPLYKTDGVFTGEYARLHDADLYFYLRTESLKEIASRTGGRYYDQNDRQGLIRFIKENLDSAPYEESAGKTTEYRSIASWFILACLPIWAMIARRFLIG